MKKKNLNIYMHPKFCMHEHFDLITNPFKYKCETLGFYVGFNIYINKCNMQHLKSGFNKLKMDDSIHVKMLII